MSSSGCSGRCWVATGTVFGFLAVFAGAFGAHGLKDSGYLERKYADETKDVAGLAAPASWKYLQDFDTGVRYHMYHALALILLGLFADRCASRAVAVAGYGFAGGIVLFSGSLYVLTILGPRWLGVPWGLVAASGGMTLLVGWAGFAVAAIRARSSGPATVCLSTGTDQQAE